MSGLLEQAARHLNSERAAENLTRLFCETLLWEQYTASPQNLQVPNPVQQMLIAQPIARLAGIPVFRVDWHLDKLPTITQRRAVYRALSKTAIEHLLCYVTHDKRQLAFVWAHKRADGKIEMRTLPYRVGSPARTTIERLAELHFPYTASEPSFSEVLQRLETAFDVEAVSKQFYQEIANWYFWASKHVAFPVPPGETNRDAYIAQSLIRLITRLLFCWFIKEMGLIPRELFEPKALAQLLKEGDQLRTSEKTTYYKAILQNLFFATLNQEIDQRRFRGKNPNGLDQHRGVTNLYRYEDLFTDPQAFLKLMKSVPFLNGGLFECLDKVYRAEENREDIRIDGFSDHPKNPLRVPDFLFFSEEQIVDLSVDYGDQRYKQTPVRGLIHILNRYNFTVTESTPFDQEVALDPELAGKVFENLLASYNPETATTARKATGSYYTPRPIVEFMVDETLIAYFQNSLNDYSSTTEQKLRKLLAYDDESHDFSPEETERLIKAIDELKALDPACGSGTFLMGLLHKLVHILSKLDPGNLQWKERQIARIREAMRTAEKIEDAVIRERTLKELEAQIASIEDAFQRNELDYGRKLYLIENCIYGVDIQPIAVQIAKMRFFISLTIEQRIDPSQPNFGIRPLPNLETKFVSANTLIGIDKPSQFALRNPEIDRLEAELRQIRERHFTARTPETKAKLRKQDAEIRAKISTLLKQDGFPAETTEKLAHWDPYDQNAVANFFDPEWMFGLKEGFDIIIGNPPYSANIPSSEMEKISPRLRYTKNRNSAALFTDIAIGHLIDSDGIISFVVPKSLIFSERWFSLVEVLSKSTKLLVDLEQGFENVLLEQVVFVYNSAHSVKEYNAIKFRNHEFHRCSTIRVDLIKHFQTWPCEVSDEEVKLGRKLSTFGLFLGELTTSFRGLPLQSRVSPRGKYPVIGGRNIVRYCVSGVKGYLFDLDKSDKKIARLFVPKVLSQQIVAHIQNPVPHIKIMATVDTEGSIVGLDTVENTVPKDNLIHVNLICALFNSKLVNWYAYRFIYCSAVRTMHFDEHYINKIPIPKEFLEKQDAIVQLVDTILLRKRQNPSADTIALERQIDQLVYQLYDLTPDEIELVERSVP